MDAVRLFGRRDQDEEEIDSVSDRHGKPKQRRRKKEEPPKPWGRRERYFVFGVLASTVLIAFFLALSARSWKLPGLGRLGLPKGVLEETYVFEGKPPAKDISRVINEFNDLTRDLSGVYGLYVINLNADETYGINEDEVFTAASLIKLPVMAGMYSEHEKGNLDLDDIYSLKNEDKRDGSGSIVYQEAGTKYSYRDLVNLMGQQSDNTAFNVVVKLLGEEFVNDYITEIGMTNTSYKENSTTPRDIGFFFKKLWTGKLVKKANRDEVLKSLTNTIYEDWIKAGIPEARVAHKFGREMHVVNDAGIVFGSDPYVLIIMSKGILETEADEVIPNLAALVHSFEME